jgi:hypothetical protein
MLEKEGAIFFWLMFYFVCKEREYLSIFLPFVFSFSFSFLSLWVFDGGPLSYLTERVPLHAFSCPHQGARLCRQQRAEGLRQGYPENPEHTHSKVLYCTVPGNTFKHSTHATRLLISLTVLLPRVKTGLTANTRIPN